MSGSAAGQGAAVPSSSGSRPLQQPTRRVTEAPSGGRGKRDHHMSIKDSTIFLSSKAETCKLLWSFKDDVEEMKDNLLTLQGVLGDAENRSRGKEAAPERRWLKKLKSVAYNIEDALEELDANAMIWKNSPRTVKLFFSSFNPLIVRITMSNKMRKIRGSLDKITDQHKKFNFMLVSDKTRQARDDQQTFVGHSDKIEMVGRVEEKKMILDLVLQKDGNQKISIIPIVGLGGMGKTTLAKSVFTAKETNMFDVKAWVHVSMELS